jgi:hypothetical protein
MRALCTPKRWHTCRTQLRENACTKRRRIGQVRAEKPRMLRTRPWALANHFRPQPRPRCKAAKAARRDERFSVRTWKVTVPSQSMEGSTRLSGLRTFASRFSLAVYPPSLLLCAALPRAIAFAQCGLSTRHLLTDDDWYKRFYHWVPLHPVLASDFQNPGGDLAVDEAHRPGRIFLQTGGRCLNLFHHILPALRQPA